MESVKKQSLVFTILSVIILLVFVTSFTFAFFTANQTSSANLLLNSSVSNQISPIFTAIPSGDLTLSVNTADMLYGYSSTINPVRTANENITITLLGGAADDAVTCSYQLIWEDLSEDEYIPSDGVETGGLKEYTLRIVENSNTNYLSETNVSNLTSGGVIGNITRTISSYGSLVTATYTVTASIYNLGIPQTIYEKIYSSIVRVANVSCTE